MKRVVVLFIVLIMITGITSAACEEYKTRIEMGENVKQYAEIMLKELIRTYESDHAKFDADYINLFNAYLKMYIAGTNVKTFETTFFIRNGLLSYDRSYFSDDDRETEKLMDQLFGKYFSDYTLWLNKELTDEDYCRRTIGSVNALITASN